MWLWAFDTLIKPCLLPQPQLPPQFQMPPCEIPVKSLLRVLLESSENFSNYKNLSGPSCSEDASLSVVSRIYFRASRKLFVLFYLESRELPLGTVKYALTHSSWAHVCISAWKSPLSLLRIYKAKLAISQVPCKVIMVDTTSGIMPILKCCRISIYTFLDQCRALLTYN